MERRTVLTTGMWGLLAAASPAGRQMTASGGGAYVKAGGDRRGRRLVLGGVTATDLKVATADASGRLLVLEHRHIRKGGPPRHVHHEQDEWFYVVEGRFVVEVGSDRFQLDVGDCIFAPRAVPHVWACVGDSPGTMIILLQPALTFETFLERLGAAPTLPDLGERARLFAAHGMTLLGPPLEVP